MNKITIVVTCALLIGLALGIPYIPYEPLRNLIAPCKHYACSSHRSHYKQKISDKKEYTAAEIH